MDDEYDPRKVLRFERPSVAIGGLSKELVFFDTIEPITDANDFVEGLLTSQGMSVIYGETNCGKTFFATDLGLHVACGWPWNGRDVTRGGVLYCALEGRHGITNRVAAFKYYHGLSTLPFAVLPVAVDMLSSSYVEAVLDTIKTAAKVTGFPVVMTVIDTLSRAVAGGNENSPETMGELVKNGTKIQQEGCTHVAWVHHTGKDQERGARGHSSLRGACDTEIEVLAENGNRTARVTKQRDLECSGEFNFGLKIVELGTNHRGKPVTSCIVDYGGDSQPVSRTPRKKVSPHKARALELLFDLIARSGEQGFNGVPPSLASVPETWWRDQFYARAMPAADQAAKQKAFRRSADELVKEHAVGHNNQRVWIAMRSDAQSVASG